MTTTSRSLEVHVKRHRYLPAQVVPSGKKVAHNIKPYATEESKAPTRRGESSTPVEERGVNLCSRQGSAFCKNKEWSRISLKMIVTPLLRFAPSLFCMLKTHTYAQLGNLLFDDKSTLVDATRHRDYLSGTRPSCCRSTLAGSLFPTDSSLLECRFLWNFLLGELDGREPLPFPITLLLRIAFHSTHFSSKALTFKCPLCATSNVSPLPLDLPSAGAAPETGLSSCHSREEKCFSRTFLLEIPDNQFFQSGVVSHVTLLIHILKCTATARAFCCCDCSS